MTLRAILIGLVLALVVAGFGHYNTVVLQLPGFANDLMPIVVFGLLLVGLLVVNPLLRLAGGHHFRGREWAVLFSLVMVVCVIPGPGLLEQFTGSMVYPVVFEAQSTGYAANADHPDMLSYVPRSMIIDSKFEGEAVRAFIQGKGTAEHPVRLIKWEKGRLVSDIPWQAWKTPLMFWMPLVLLGFIASVALALVLHRQWAYREHLRYPMAEVASELIGQQQDETGFNPLFKNRLFWLGFAVSAFVLCVNGLNKYYAKVPAVSNEIGLAAMDTIFPFIEKMPKGPHLLHIKLWFAAAGLAFLVPSDVSFSIGISHLAYAVVYGVLLSWGANMTNDYFAGGVHSFAIFGAYFAGAIVVLYAGRNYYWAVLRKAFFLSVRDDVDRTAAWACRVLIACVLAMVCMLHYMLGLDWFLSILLILSISLIFLIATRMNVETGVLLVQPTWQAVGILAGFFGMQALGPQALIIAGMLSMVLTDDPRVCLMPLIANSLWVADKQKVHLPRLSGWMSVALLAGVVLAVPLVLQSQYDKGEARAVGGWTKPSEQMVYDMLKRGVDKLVAENSLPSAGTASEGWGGLQRLGQIQPTSTFLAAAGVGLALVLLTYAARLRWTWWPLHPVMFMVWGTFFTAHYSPSFLFGWLMKVIITRFSGGMGYRKARPFFIGLIAGEMAAAILWIVVGLLYFAYMGNKGPIVTVRP